MSAAEREHERDRVTVRLSPSQAATLDALAAEHGGSRSVTLRKLIDSAQSGGMSVDRMDRDDVVELLQQHARAGSVPAARELLQRLDVDAELERLRALTT